MTFPAHTQGVRSSVLLSFLATRIASSLSNPKHLAALSCDSSVKSGPLAGWNIYFVPFPCQPLLHGKVVFVLLELLVSDQRNSGAGWVLALPSPPVLSMFVSGRAIWANVGLYKFMKPRKLCNCHQSSISPFAGIHLCSLNEDMAPQIVQMESTTTVALLQLFVNCSML